MTDRQIKICHIVFLPVDICIKAKVSFGANMATSENIKTLSLDTLVTTEAILSSFEKICDSFII